MAAEVPVLVGTVVVFMCCSRLGRGDEAPGGVAKLPCNIVELEVLNVRSAKIFSH